MHVGIDASSWDNERGFGRFTRSLVAALARRKSGLRYTLLFDTPTDRPVPDGVEVQVAGAGQSMAQASSGKGARVGSDMLAQSRAAAGMGCDVFFFPAVYSYYPILSRVPKVICFHDTIPERFPDLIFPTARNFRLWQAKIWLAKWQATRVMTVSQTSAADISAMLRVRPDRIDVVTEGAEDVFRPIRDPAIRAAARARARVPEGVPLLVYVGGFNRHKNVLRLIEAMACGTPVLASDRGSLPEVVGDAGLFFDPESPHELAAQAVAILTDARLQSDFATRALVRASDFGWDKAAALAEASFRRAVGRG